MNEGGMSAADVMALANNNEGWNNPFIYLILFAFLGNNGFGAWGNRGGEFTRSEMQDGFNNQTVINKLNGLEHGLCDGFYTQNTTLLNNFNNVDRGLEQIKFENSQNTCKITSTIHDEAERTRALIAANQTQMLRDELAQTKLQLSQVAQNAYLIDKLTPAPAATA